MYKNDNATFEELLKIDNSVTVHLKNLQKLATEMYKAKEQENAHELRNGRTWENPNVRTVSCGIERNGSHPTAHVDVVKYTLQTLVLSIFSFFIIHLIIYTIYLLFSSTLSLAIFLYLYF